MPQAQTLCGSKKVVAYSNNVGITLAGNNITN